MPTISNFLNINGSADADGVLPIGSTAQGYATWGNLTSTGGTLTITNGSHTINLEAGGTTAASFPTDSGTAVPSAGVLTVHGTHNINTSASGSTVSVNGNNTITVGDLASVAGSDAITVTTGNVTVTAGNINLPNSNGSGSAGVIKFGGDRWISNFGTANTFVGDLSGNFTTTSSNNVCIGADSGFSLTSGGVNTFVGTNAGASCTTGGENVGIGNGALASFTTGIAAGNTACGQGALGSMTTGVNNIGIGNDAGVHYIGAESNNIMIGAFGTLGESAVLRIGGNGTTGTAVTTAYVAGIYGVTPAVSGTNQMVIQNNVGQLGTQAIPSVNVIPITTVNHAASPYTVLTADRFLSVDVSGGVVTILMPNAPTTGQVYSIKDAVGLSGTSNITVTTVGGAVNIDGATSFVMNTPYEAINLIFNGTSYEVY